MHAPVGLLVVGLAFSILTLITVQTSPQFSLAASVVGGPAVLLASSWMCLLAAAAQLSWGDGLRRRAVLLALAGLAWLIPEWDNPDAHPVPYAAAILLTAVTPALLVHAVLAGSGRLPGSMSRNLVIAGYLVCVGLQGLAPALVLDPAALACSDCPTNPWLVHADAGALTWLETVAGIATAGWLACCVLALGPVAVPAAGRPGDAGIGVPTSAFVLVVLVWQLADLGGLQSRDPIAARLWLLASLALIATAGGALWQLATTRRTRRLMNRIVLELSQAGEPGRFRDVFAGKLGDPTLQLLYGKAGGGLVDAHGRTVAVGTDRKVTPLVLDGTPLAMLAHSRALALSADAVNKLAAGMYLGLEHEALTAQALAEERDLRDSGLRLIAARDAERSHLERDLHDGAQQRLVGMALGLQLIARHCPGPPVEEARRELASAIAEVRAIAQGLSPPVLVDAGLGAALRSLAETRALRVVTGADRRMDPALEATVYLLVERSTRATAASVDVSQDNGTLLASVVLDGDAPDLTAVADRVLTLGGRMHVRPGDQGTTEIKATLPLPGL